MVEVRTNNDGSMTNCMDEGFVTSEDAHRLVKGLVGRVKLTVRSHVLGASRV